MQALSVCAVLVSLAGKAEKDNAAAVLDLYEL